MPRSGTSQIFGGFMAERFVRDKSARQHRVEGLLFYLLPTVIAGSSLFVSGWIRLLASPLALISFYAISPIGNLFATAFGSGEKIAPEERWRRNINRATSVSGWRLFGSLFFLYTLLGLSALLPFLSISRLWEDGPLLASIGILGGAFAAICTTSYVRGQRRVAQIEPTQENAPLPPWRWLAGYLPIHYLCYGAGLVGGYLMALQVRGALQILLIFVGFLLGGLGVTLMQRVTYRRRPITWSQMSFLQAFTTGVLQMGVLIAALLFEVVSVTGKLDVSEAAIWSSAGLAFGTAFVLFLWVVSKLNNAGWRSRA